MMFNELILLFNSVINLNASKDEYFKAIITDNCLNKRSFKTRELSARHLIELYSLDVNYAVFRNLRYFWERDHEARPLLALLCAYTRDNILRIVTPYILGKETENRLNSIDVAEYIESKLPDRFSTITCKSIAQNINATFTQSGHLQGRTDKRRKKANATSASTAYALLLGYLSGTRGYLLFQTDYMKLLDCSFERAIGLAEVASKNGWINMKRIGDIIEITFLQLLTEKERKWLDEQNRPISQELR